MVADGLSPGASVRIFVVAASLDLELWAPPDPRRAGLVLAHTLDPRLLKHDRNHLQVALGHLGEDDPRLLYQTLTPSSPSEKYRAILRSLWVELE